MGSKKVSHNHIYNIWVKLHQKNVAFCGNVCVYLWVLYFVFSFIFHRLNFPINQTPKLVCEWIYLCVTRILIHYVYAKPSNEYVHMENCWIIIGYYFLRTEKRHRQRRLKSNASKRQWKNNVNAILLSLILIMMICVIRLIFVQRFTWKFNVWRY